MLDLRTADTADNVYDMGDGRIVTESFSGKISLPCDCGDVSLREEGRGSDPFVEVSTAFLGFQPALHPFALAMACAFRRNGFTKNLAVWILVTF
jgi:hypothetical protein